MPEAMIGVGQMIDASEREAGGSFVAFHELRIHTQHSYKRIAATVCRCADGRPDLERPIKDNHPEPMIRD